MPAGPLLVVITGPSGVGKDSLLASLRDSGRSYHFGVTATTRPPRPGEKREAGRFLRHLPAAAFESMLARGEFLEHAVVYGHRYGVPRAPIREALARGQDVVLRTDIQGARYIKSVVPGAVTIFLLPPSWEELARRLRARASDSPQQMELRLRIAREELAAAGEFDHTVVNEDLDRCAQAVEAVLAAERARPERQAVRV